MTRPATLAALAALPLLAMFPATQALADETPVVVASIKPVHSLVAAVMAGVGEPSLIVQGGQSEHTASLRPSDARTLAEADLVFWIGPNLEAFLAGPLETVASGAEVVTLSEAPGLLELPFREGGMFEAHDHGDEHEHAAGDGHDDADHSVADHRDDEHEHEHEGHEHHDHGAVDMHLWLDPDNARAFVPVIEAALARIDPAHAPIYEANAADLVARIDALAAEMAATLEPVRDRPFIVFHDGYHYLENRFDLHGVGSITVSPEVMPGAARIAEIHGKVAALDAACVFSEPQFEPRLVDIVIEGTGARTGVLDTLGTDIPDGPDLYFELMRRNAEALRACLSGAE